ncbi:MAG: glycosyltransferase family 9 protein [Acidobacteriota bacterium]|nr:glycosyltransferase family 9 protein [Acidobacteriota bacterium]
MPERRFLVVRLGSLGDIVHTFPAVAALRESFPAAEIIWLTHPRWKLLVASSGLASKIWTTETRSFSAWKKTIREIRNTAFDTAIDYQGLWKSAASPFFAGVRQRIGFSPESVREFGVPLLYTDRVHATSSHVADQNGELSQRAGALAPVTELHLEPPPVDDAAFLKYLSARGVDRYVVLSPGGGWRSKCWPPERFGALCRMISDSLALRCVVNYGPGEDDLAAKVRVASSDKDPMLFNGELGPLMSLLRHAECVVGGDTGPLHLAVALGTSVVGLFGPTDPMRNGPYRAAGGSAATHRPATAVNSQDIVLRAPNVITTHARGDQPHPSMLEIRVDAVFEAVRRIVKARS